MGQRNRTKGISQIVNMEGEPGPSARFARQFARSPDGLPPFDNTAEDSIDPVFGDRTSERQEVTNRIQAESLYAVFNLPMNATLAEIRDRYRSLAVAFHPDKHRPSATEGDSTGKPAADDHFSRIQDAYAVLSDPHKRAVYDVLGFQGLQQLGEETTAESNIASNSWKVVRRLGSPEQIKQHYQRVVYEKRLASIEAMVKAKGDISLNVDARAAFLPKSFFADPTIVKHDILSRGQRIRIGGMAMKYNFETPINPQTSVVWQGQMMSRNGPGGSHIGGGNVVGTIRHAFGSKVWIEAGSSLLNPRVATGKITYAHDQDTFATANVVQQTIMAPPTLAITVGRKILPRTTGFLTVRSGFWSLGPWGQGLATSLGRTDAAAVSVGLTNQGHTGTGWTLETTGGIVDKHISLDYTLQVLYGFKVKVGAAVGTMGGLNGFVNTERQITPNTRLGVGLTAMLPGGITLRLRMWRLGQKVVVPIMLSQDLNPTVALFSTVVPAASIIILHYWYLNPRRKRGITSKVDELQEEHAEYLAQKKADALDAVALMDDYVSRKVEQERSNDSGLIIISGHYGLSSAFTPTGLRNLRGHESKVVDVTIPLQALVNNGKLNIPGNRAKFNLLGFYDPCMGEPKSLRVKYLFHGRLHEVTVDDLAAIRAPIRQHALEDSRNGNWEM